jgi:ABC-type polysaccharide/polyol phosphate export permease
VFVSFYVFDSHSAPHFLRTIAEALPLYPLIHGLSAALVTGTSLTSNLSDLGVIAVWAALGIWLAIRGFSWE